MNSKLAKEIIILILLIIVVLFVLFVLLYDFIPGKNESIKSVEYVAENSVSDILEEIKENTGVDVEEKNQETPLKSYSVEAEDLDVYESENSYESGKSNPFDEEADPAEEILRTTTDANTKTKQSSNSYKNEVKEEKKLTNTATIVNTVESNSKKEEAKADTKVETKNEKNKTETKKETKNETSTGSFFESVDRK